MFFCNDNICRSSLNRCTSKTLLFTSEDQGGAEIGWQIFDYTSITPKSNFKCLSVFADKDETPHLPGANWDLTFSEQNARPDDPVGRGITKVSISIYFESLEELEKMIEMGFNEGFTVTLNELTSLLKTLKK